MKRLAATAVAAGFLVVPAAHAADVPAGRIAHDTLVNGGQLDIAVGNSDGSGSQNLTQDAQTDTRPAFSPDGTKIAYCRSADSTGLQVWLMNADGGNKHPLTSGPSSCSPAWSPDGTKLAFQEFVGPPGRHRIAVMPSTGGPAAPVTSPGAEETDSDPSWSPDGTRLVFTRKPTNASETTIATVPAGGGAVTPIAASPAGTSNNFARWSPDGSQIGYVRGVVQQARAAAGDGAIHLMTPTGQGDVQVVGTAGALGTFSFSADGAWIAFGARITDAPSQIYAVPLSGGSAVNVTNTSTQEAYPSWATARDPIVFLHGFLGSRIVCGDGEAWPALPVTPPRPLSMRLAADGISDATGSCSVPSGGPGLIRRVLDSDVYDSTAAFLQDVAPQDSHFFAWDWRKSPEQSLQALDQFIDQVRAPGGKVVLMAHSMGGLVTRWYIDDAARAKKVSRALTIGTPYWGSPKALFPVAAGVESPAPSSFDLLFDNDELQSFARTLQGLYFLWPSAPYGGWLSVAGRSPAPLSGGALAQFVDGIGGSSALLTRAGTDHAAHLDRLALNGVDYHVLAGTGLNTIGPIRILPLLGGRALYFPDWVNGDGTVPRESARMGSTIPAGRLHFACGIGHVALPGDPAVTARIKDFLLSGKPIAGADCDRASSGFELYSANLALGTASAVPAAMTPAAAQRAGLVELLDLPEQTLIATDASRPVTMTLTGRRLALRVTPLSDGTRGKPVYYARVRGPVQVDAGEKLTLTRAGKVVKPLPRADRKPPRTRARVRTRGRRAILRFRARDSSGVAATWMQVGKAKAKRVRGPQRIPRKRLRRVRFQSVDVFGNVEKPRRPRRR